MGSVVDQDGGRRTAVNYYEALNEHPVGSNGLPRILMAAFARQYAIRVFRDLVIHRLKPWPLASLLMDFLEALRRDPLVFPFTQQEFDHSRRQREFLLRFSIRASQYKRTRSAVPVRPFPGAGGPSWEASSVLSSHAYDTKPPGCPG